MRDHHDSACGRRAGAPMRTRVARDLARRGHDRAAAEQRTLGFAPACTHRQVGRADAPLRALGQEPLHPAILQRLEADPRQHAAVAQQPPGQRQRPVELIELFVDGDPQRLERTLGRMATREPGRRGNRADDRVDQVLGGLDRVRPVCVRRRTIARAIAFAWRSSPKSRRVRASRRSSQVASTSRAVNSWSGSIRMSSGASYEYANPRSRVSTCIEDIPRSKYTMSALTPSRRSSSSACA